MNIDQLNAQFSDETICRKFFEAARWPEGGGFALIVLLTFHKRSQ